MISKRTKPRAYKKWTHNERQELERLVFEENLSFSEIERIMGRSSVALRLQLGTMIEQIDWSTVPRQGPAAVNPSLDDVARHVIAGSSPHDIARLFPRLFIQNFEGIIQLWQVLNKKQWRFRP